MAGMIGTLMPAWGSESRVQSIDVVPDSRTRSIEVIPEPSRDFSVRVDSDENRYYVGESVRIRFSASHDAHVYIFNTDSSGVTRQIFPNYYDRDNFVRGGRTYTLPRSGYSLRVTGPEGSERLRIVGYRREYRALRQWHEFRSSDPYPRRSVSPEAMSERIRTEVRQEGSGGMIRIDREIESGPRAGQRESLRIVPEPDRFDYAEDYDFFTVRRPSYSRYEPRPRPDYRPVEPWSRYDYDYSRPRAYRPDPAYATASLRVSTSPSGADVYVDDIYYGRTPDTFRVEPGRREVVLYHPDYGSRTTTINVRSGSTSAISMSFPRR